MVSSGAATGGVQGWGAYSASKAALNSVVRTLGNEEPDVVSIALRPGVVDTEMQEIIRDKGEFHRSLFSCCLGPLMMPSSVTRRNGTHEAVGARSIHGTALERRSELAPAPS